MTVDQLLAFSASQSPVEIERTVSILGPELKRSLDHKQVIPLNELISHPEQHDEIFLCRYGHILEPGLATDDINAWASRHPQFTLPHDLFTMLSRVNGIHLWADLASKRSYFGILPIKDWQDAKASVWAVMFEAPPASCIVMSYHENGDYFLVLNTTGPAYYWYDLQYFDNPKYIGSKVGELLEWLCQETDWLDPRKQ